MYISNGKNAYNVKLEADVGTIFKTSMAKLEANGYHFTERRSSAFQPARATPHETDTP
jgi:hypothetical protein